MSEMKVEHHNKFGILSSLMESDDLIRVLITIETLSRSGKDFQELISRLFGRTWEFKILDLFMKYGPMNKAQVCLKLFPNLKDGHYKLSRSNQVSSAFDNLLNNSIIVVVKDFGKKKIYDISLSYKPILQAIFHGNIFALLETQ